jgi:hypothetical protein
VITKQDVINQIKQIYTEAKKNIIKIGAISEFKLEFSKIEIPVDSETSTVSILILSNDDLSYESIDIQLTDNISIIMNLKNDFITIHTKKIVRTPDAVDLLILNDTFNTCIKEGKWLKIQ